MLQRWKVWATIGLLVIMPVSLGMVNHSGGNLKDHDARDTQAMIATSAVTVSATFTNRKGQALLNQGNIAVGSAIVIHPTAQGVVDPVYQIWVKPPHSSVFLDLGGYASAPANGFSVPVTMPGTYAVNIYVSASVQGTNPVEAPLYTFTATGAASTTTDTPTVAATFTNEAGHRLANHGSLAVGSAIIVKPTSTGMTHPLYQIWVKTPTSSTFVDLGGYESVPPQGFSIPVTTAGTYELNMYASASAAGTDPTEAEPYTFVAQQGKTASKPSSPVTYYVNAVTGNNANSGTSPAAPWRGLARLNQTVFQPGVVIRFRSGQSWTGALTLEGNGTSAHPITVTSYGPGTKPILRNNGNVVSITNEGGWVLQGLSLKELNPSSMTSGGASGSVVDVAYTVAHPAPYPGITIADNTIQGLGPNTNTWGINIGGLFPFSYNGTVSRGIVIKNNRVDNVGWVGIHTYGWNPNASANLDSAQLFSDVQVEDNTVYDTGDNGVVLGSTNHSIIRKNVVHATGLYSGLANPWSPSALWIIASSYDVVEGNRVYDAHTGGMGTDGAGLDIDWTTSHCVFKYNVSYDNAGAGLETMANRSNTISHNWFWNDNRDGINGGGVIALTGYTGDVGPHAFSGTRGDVVDNNWIVVTEPNSYAFSTYPTEGSSAWRDDVFQNNKVVLAANVSGIGAYMLGVLTNMRVINHNVFYSVRGRQFSAANAAGLYHTLAAWSKATGYDKNSVLRPLPATLPAPLPPKLVHS